MAKKKDTEKTSETANFGGYKKPKDLMEAVFNYITECENRKTFPDEAGMFIKIGLTKETAEKIYEKGGEWAHPFEYAKLERESWLSRRMCSDPKLATGCMNALKQEKNGGYIDRPAKDNKPQELVVKFSKNITMEDLK